MAPIFHALKRIYEGNTQGALRGAAALYNQAKKQRIKGVTMENVKSFLASQASYYTQRRARVNFKRRKINASFTGDLVQGDIFILDRFSESNDSFKYALVIVDTFSKHLSVNAMKNRSTQELKRAFTEIMGKCGYKWYSLLFDWEGAISSQEIQSWLKGLGIVQMRTLSKTKV